MTSVEEATIRPRWINLTRTCSTGATFPVVASRPLNIVASKPSPLSRARKPRAVSDAASSSAKAD